MNSIVIKKLSHKTKGENLINVNGRSKEPNNREK